jgi:hypothetical protein
MFRAVANSPAALKSMWGRFGALGAGTIGAKLGEHTNYVNVALGVPVDFPGVNSAGRHDLRDPGRFAVPDLACRVLIASSLDASGGPSKLRR